MKSSVKKRKLAPYAKALVARRIAEDVPGLVVVATGFNAGTEWTDNERVSRIVVPLDSDPAEYDWYLPLVDLDVLIAPSDDAPDAWLTRLAKHVWSGDPRMVWIQEDNIAWMMDRPVPTMRFEMWHMYPLETVLLSELGRRIRQEEKKAIDAERGARLSGDEEWTADQWFR